MQTPTSYSYSSYSYIILKLYKAALSSSYSPKVYKAVLFSSLSLALALTLRKAFTALYFYLPLTPCFSFASSIPNAVYSLRHTLPLCEN